MKSEHPAEAAPHLTRGSVLDDLGFSPAEALELRVKADVYRDLMTYIRGQAYTQRQLETLLGMPQPDVSNLLNGRVAKFSVAKLLRLAGKLNLGAEVRLTIPKPTGAIGLSAATAKPRRRSQAVASQVARPALMRE